MRCVGECVCERVCVSERERESTAINCYSAVTLSYTSWANAH